MNVGRALIVMPTYNEHDNVPKIVPEILAASPEVDILIVDDSSPDGTGEVADALARRDSRVKVLHRPHKDGLGRAYLAGFAHALSEGYGRVLEMDADCSHDPPALPSLLRRPSTTIDRTMIRSRDWRAHSAQASSLPRSMHPSMLASSHTSCEDSS